MPEWHLDYGLDRDPFDDGGVQGLYFPGGARQETVEQLQHLARFSDNQLLVRGPAGAGKTSTMARFVAASAPDTDLCVIEASLLEAREQLLRRILHGFGVDPPGAPALEHDLRALADCCESRQRHGRLCWVVIDDAQHLDADAAALLPMIIATTHSRLRLVLFAEPQWLAVFRPLLAEGQHLHVIELSPLDPADTCAYIHYRMKTAGLEGELPFTAAELEQIHRESLGMPGRINALAGEILSRSVGEVQQPLSTLPVWHFGVVAITLIALLLLFYWNSLQEGRQEHDVPRPAVSTGTLRQDPVTPIVADDAPPPPAAGPETGLVELVRPEPIGEGVEPQVDSVETKTGDPLGTMPVAVEAEAEAEPVAAAEEPAVPDADELAVPAELAPDEPAEKRYVYRTEGRVGGGLTADEEYLLALDGARFTLQIMGSDDLAKLQDFARAQSIPLRQYRKLRNGRQWYALVHGEYRGRAEAEDALAGLPASVRRLRPWIRRLDGVQAEIRQANAL